jgi:hypothetical protein
MSTERKFHIPTDAEDAVLTGRAESDPDSPPLKRADLERMQPTQAVLPDLIGTPKADAPLKRHSNPQDK